MTPIRAAAASIDITPEPGIWLSGYAARQAPSTGIHDKLLARVLMLDDGATRCALVSCDLIGLSPADTADIQKDCEQRGCLPADNVIVSCTHTHSGPASLRFRGCMGIIDEAWLARTKSRIADCIVSLPDRLAPASIAYAHALLPGLGFNRQDQSRPADDLLQSVRLFAPDGSVIATILNYAVHAVVLGPRNLLISGDVPGAAARAVESCSGAVCLYLQGACGDIDPIINRERGWGTGTFDDIDRIGSDMAAAAHSALNSSSVIPLSSLNLKRKTIDVPLDPHPSDSELTRLEASFISERAIAEEKGLLVDAHCADVMLLWASELRQAMRNNTVSLSVSASVSVVALNDIRIIGIPFEPYSGIAHDLRESLKPLKVLVAGYTNGLFGYCPTRWAKDQGGYGADSSCRWFPGMLTAIGYGADDLLITTLAEMA